MVAWNLRRIRVSADRFAYYAESAVEGPHKAVIVFEAHARRLRFDLPLAGGKDARGERLRRRQWREPAPAGVSVTCHRVIAAVG